MSAWTLAPGTFWADERTLVGGDPFRSMRLTERGAAFVRRLLAAAPHDAPASGPASSGGASSGGASSGAAANDDPRSAAGDAPGTGDEDAGHRPTTTSHVASAAGADRQRSAPSESTPATTVHAPAEAALLARLARANLLVAPLAESTAPHDVTLVVPAKASAESVQRVLDLAPGVPAIVVDDGSTPPLSGALRHDADLRVVRNEASLGPAAGRNLGARAAGTRYVAFCDADISSYAGDPGRHAGTEPRASGDASAGDADINAPAASGWIGALRANVGGALVAAPRIVSEPAPGLAARFEQAVCALDVGDRPGFVSPAGVLSYVPSAALLVDRERFLALGGFDESMQVGEDVDFCWRAAADGVYYEPRVVLRHRPRAALGDALARRATYGESSAALAGTHPTLMRHGSFPVAAAAPWLLAMAGRPRLAAIASLAHVALAPRSMKQLPASAARRAALTGQWQSARALSRMTVRPLLPLTAALALLGRGFGRRAAAVALAATALDSGVLKSRATEPQTPEQNAAAASRTSSPTVARGLAVAERVGWQLLDDAAYSAGAWRGAARSGRFGLLLPHLRLGRGGVRQSLAAARDAIGRLTAQARQSSGGNGGPA